MTRTSIGMFCIFTTLLACSAEGANVPPFAEVKTFVEQTLATKANYQSGDLITHADVVPILQELAKVGIRFDPTFFCPEVFLADQSPLATLLRTPKNLPIMRALGQKPENYDRLERLTRFADGLNLVQQAFDEPDPIAAVNKLCSHEVAVALEVRFSREPQAQNLEADSGGIYTEKQFLEYLQLMYGLAENKLASPQQ